jgi:hypothetical protein
MITALEFIARVEEIAAEGPSYQHGHDGSDGYCDCIGLIIGAIRRCGGVWRGIHGSNYAARSAVEKVDRIGDKSELKPGDLVFKSYDPGDEKYSLPGRYRAGGEMYTGDLRDYYHVGVVVSADPLRIRHMTTPKPKMDTSLGRWSWHGWLKRVQDQEEGASPMDQGIMVNYQARVIGDGMLNMRAAPDSKATRIMQLPVGAVVSVNQELQEGRWFQISYGGKTGYAMSMYLEKDTTTGSMITVDRAALEAVYDEIGNLLGLRG